MACEARAPETGHATRSHRRGGGREVIPPRRLVGVARSSAVRHGGFRGLERQNICVSVYEMQLEEERAASVFTQWVAVRAR